MSRKKQAILTVVACVLTFSFAAAAADTVGVRAGSTLPKGLAGLAGPFDLAGPLKPEVRHYIQETEFVHFGFDGKRTGSETYTVKLKIVPAALSDKGADEITLREFVIRPGTGAPETIPSLAGWSYLFRNDEASGGEGKGLVFGIPHAKFIGLTTDKGATIPPLGSYPIYNSFVDFHAFNDVFGRPAEGGGIQDLKAIGQTVRHASAFSEPPVHLGEGIKEGSVFRNGDIRLTFKGVGLVDGAACAIVGYHSGESTLKMIMPQSDGKEMITEGGSHYAGEIYVDLATRWVRKVTMDEYVVTETRLPAAGAAAKAGNAAGAGPKFPAYIVRHLLTRMISREEFEK
jgi:hypothetical protein